MELEIINIFGLLGGVAIKKAAALNLWSALDRSESAPIFMVSESVAR